VFVDDSDVIKPYGKKFESLGIVRDGSAIKPTLEKGYHVTEIAALTSVNKQPVSIFSRIHSSTENNDVSVNDTVFKGLEQAFELLPDSTCVFDRGYDMNALICFLFRNQKEYLLSDLNQ